MMAQDRPSRRRTEPGAQSFSLNPIRDQKIFDRIVHDRISAAQVGREFGITRERVRQILKLQFGIQPNELRTIRAAEIEYARLTAPREAKICKFCGEDFRVEGWSAHQMRRRHNPNPKATYYMERHRAVAADYAAVDADGKPLMKIREILDKYNIYPGDVTRAARYLGVPLRKPQMGRHSKTNAEGALIKATIVALNEAGVPDVQIAAQVGCSTSWVTMVLAAAGRPSVPGSTRAQASRERMRRVWAKYRARGGTGPLTKEDFQT